MLFVNEIFHSISGEVGGFPQGANAVFIRLAGCNLKCPYCDASDSQDVSKCEKLRINEIIDRVSHYDFIDNIVITGGEPMLQKQKLISLVKILIEKGKKISIETNGTLKVPFILFEMPQVTIVSDYKIFMIDKMADTMELNALILRESDFIKMVIETCEIPYAIRLHEKLIEAGVKAKIAYSPVMPDISDITAPDISFFANSLFRRLSERGLNGILNLQIHKIIGMR